MLSKQDLLDEIIEHLTLVFKYNDIPESDVHASVASAYESVLLPQDTPPSTPPIPLDHAFFLESLLGLWRTDARFLDEFGNSLGLRSKGPHPSLESLIEATRESVAPMPDDLDANLVVERIVSHGSAVLDGEHLRLKMAHFRVRSKGSPASLSQLDYIRGFCQTSAHNTYKGQGGRIQRLARTKHFPADKVPVVNQMLEDQGMQFLETFDEYISTVRKPSTKSDGKTVFLGVGIYLIEDPED